MASNRLTIQSAIVTALGAVSGVYNVFTGYPSSDAMDEVIDNFVPTNDQSFQVWQLRRVSTMVETAESTGYGQGIAIGIQANYMHDFVLGFWYGIVYGVSEPVFQALCDAVLDAFIAKRTLGGFTTMKPLELATITERAYQDVVCHYAEFRVTVVDMQSGLAPA